MESCNLDWFWTRKRGKSGNARAAWQGTCGGARRSSACIFPWQFVFDQYALDGFRRSGFRDAVNVWVGNFPAKIVLLAAQFHMLFQENRAATIPHKRPAGYQQNIADAVLHRDVSTQEIRVRRHLAMSFSGGKRGVNSTEGLLPEKMWKT